MSNERDRSNTGDGPTQSEQAEPLCLSFKTNDDAIDYANHLVEDGSRWLARNNLALCKRYEGGNLEVVVKCRSVRDGNQFHLVFRRVPPGRKTEPGDLGEKCAGDRAASGVH